MSGAFSYLWFTKWVLFIILLTFKSFIYIYFDCIVSIVVTSLLLPPKKLIF